MIVLLDTTRVGSWEIWQAGIVFAGHTLPAAWAVVPYPWPKGRFRSTTLALVRQLQEAFPPEQQWALVADRGFPSAALFGQLLGAHISWTVRLRLCGWIEVEGVYARVADHLDQGRLRSAQRVAVTIGRGTPEQPTVKAWVVVNQVIPLPPKHKQNPGTARERAARAKARRKHLSQEGRKSSPPSERARRHAQTWVLFTTADTAAAAVVPYLPASRSTVEYLSRCIRDRPPGRARAGRACVGAGLHRWRGERSQWRDTVRAPTLEGSPERMRESHPRRQSEHSEVAITPDVDWASDDVLEPVIERMRRAGVKATLFATHESSVLRALDGNQFEVGLHPNFNRTGGDFVTPIRELKRLYPGAQGGRSHSLFVSSHILAEYTANGLNYESNVFLPYHEGLHPVRRVPELVTIPYYWEDDNHLSWSQRFRLEVLGLGQPGLKIYNFHPIHVFMNTYSEEHYAAYKAYYRDVSKLAHYLEPRDREGIGRLFCALLEEVASRRWATRTLAEIAESYLGPTVLGAV